MRQAKAWEEKKTNNGGGGGGGREVSFGEGSSVAERSSKSSCTMRGQSVSLGSINNTM